MTSNNKAIDLWVSNSKGEATHIFEVKSSTDTQSIYTAVGQLFLNSLDFKVLPTKVIVLPNTLDTEKKKHLKKLGIKVVTYRLFDFDYQFYGLDNWG